MFGRTSESAGREMIWELAPGLTVIVFVLAATACDGGDLSPTAGDADAFPAYSVRGRVLEVSEDALTLHHEAVDDFVGASGKVTGMDAMVMRFHLARRLRDVDLAEGAKVEIRFEARNTKPKFVITSLRGLPPDTELQFRAARPPDPSER